MARDFPPGFELRRGLDGLLLGLSIVFVVRLQMIFSTLIDWRLVPEWTYVPIKQFFAAVNQGIRAAIQSLSSPVDSSNVVGVDAGAAAGSAGSASGSIDPSSLPLIVQFIGSPSALFGALGASLLEQLLIIVGFWIAVLVPLWFWGLRPLLFWWRSTDLFQTPRPD